MTDCKSKFGTSVKKRKLSADERVELHSNDVIKFGQGPNHNISRFKYVHNCKSLTFFRKLNFDSKQGQSISIKVLIVLA